MHRNSHVTALSGLATTDWETIPSVNGSAKVLLLLSRVTTVVSASLPRYAASSCFNFLHRCNSLSSLVIARHILYSCYSSTSSSLSLSHTSRNNHRVVTSQSSSPGHSSCWCHLLLPCCGLLDLCCRVIHPSCAAHLCSSGHSSIISCSSSPSHASLHLLKHLTNRSCILLGRVLLNASPLFHFLLS